MPQRNGFTLVELLVVVAIIAVLLALLMPAMDKAIYQAELVACAGRLKASGSGFMLYAMGNGRRYPHREGSLDPNNLGWRPNQLSDKTYDDRPAIFKAVESGLLLDPFCAKIDLESNARTGLYYANYYLWFGLRFLKPAGEKGMNRIGDPMTYTDPDTGKVSRFNLLIGDADRLYSNSDQSTHPDSDEKLLRTPGYQDAVNTVPGWGLQGAYVTFSNWSTGGAGSRIRGTLDLNYAFEDGAVLRFSDVQIADARMQRVPDHTVAAPNNLASAYIQLPEH